MSASMNTLFQAIVEDDRSKVEELLIADASLATRLVHQEKLFETGILHWLYVGDTALHLAAAGHRVEIVQRLLAARADVNSARNRRASAPLHYAADGFITGLDWEEKRQVQTIEVLISAGACIHASDKNGATPLHRATRTRCAAAVKCLLNAGANPTQKNKSGSTPFHLAVQNTGRGGSGADEAHAAQRCIIQTFLAAGVSKTLTDSHGKTVSDCAQSSWIRELLA